MTVTDQKYRPGEHLKRKTYIRKVFSDGCSLYVFPIRFVYASIARESEHQYAQIGVSVSKRFFRKATDRNKIKRWLREAYRKNKYLVDLNKQTLYAGMFIYTGKQLPDYVTIEKSMQALLKQFTTLENRKNE